MGARADGFSYLCVWQVTQYSGPEGRINRCGLIPCLDASPYSSCPVNLTVV